MVGHTTRLAPASLRALACALALSILTAAPVRAADSIATVIDGFSTARAWSTLRDEARLKAEYGHWAMRIENGGYRGPCLSLSFSLLASSADIWGSFDIVEPFDSIGVWVQDPSRTPGQLTLGLVDADGATYVSPAVVLPTDGKWHRCEFTAASFTLGSWSKDRNARLDYPVTRVVPVFAGIQPGVPVTVRLDELSVTRPRPARMRAARVSVPRQAMPGEAVRVSASFVPLEAIPASGCELRLVHDGAILDRLVLPARQWPVGREQRLGPVSLRLPGRAWPGATQVVFRMRGATIVGQPNDVLGSV
jgi:hypothetical protein